MINLTAIVLTQNNQETLPVTLSSLKFVSEILVIDDNSSDTTVKVAKKYGAKVIPHALKGDWSEQRNFALTKAKTDWVLFIDSDEVVTSSLKKEISRLKPGDTAGYYLKRLDVFCGATLNHGETGNIKLLRLARREVGHWIRPVHEIWQVKGRTKTLTAPLLHIRHFDISTLISRFDTYSTIDAREFSHHPFSFLSLLKPLAKFVYNYIYLLGFLDGLAGLTFAYLMSFYSLAVRIKTWEIASSRSA